MQDRAAIEAAIPHRDPFLFVDSIIAQSDEGITCGWTVPAQADWFRGHYPGNPITPGVIISEHAFQCAAIFISNQMRGLDAQDGVPVLTKIENARYKRIVKPGEMLETKVSVRERLGPAWYLSAKVTCGGQSVLNIRFVLSGTEAMKRVTEA